MYVWTRNSPFNFGSDHDSISLVEVCVLLALLLAVLLPVLYAHVLDPAM